MQFSDFLCRSGTTVCFLSTILLSPYALASVVSGSVSKTWQTEVYVTASPIKDADGAIFAVKVELLNRSKNNTALFTTFNLPRNNFGLDVQERNINGPRVTFGDPLGPVDSKPDLKWTTLEIPPNKSAVFCLKLEDQLLPGIALNRSINYLWTVESRGDLRWKHRGKDMIESKTTKTFSPRYYFFEGLILGEHKASIQKGKGCDATP